MQKVECLNKVFREIVYIVLQYSQMDFEVSDILLSTIFGFIPAIIWLFFWLREDNLHPEPRHRLIKTFFFGMFAVILVIPLQHYIRELGFDDSTRYASWSLIEELLKLFAAYFAALGSVDNDEPIDSMIYLITAAMGFATLENIFFSLGQLEDGGIIGSAMLSNIRFLGATLVHVISSAIVGLGLSIAFYQSKGTRFVFGFLGIGVAVVLHALFNLFIINGSELNVRNTLGILWLSAIILMIIFEEIKAIKPRAQKII